MNRLNLVMVMDLLWQSRVEKSKFKDAAISNEKRPIFFLLKAKCQVIANDMGVNEGDLILMAINI